MKYLFKTFIIDHYGTASYEIFLLDDGSYKCIQASWNGYMKGPGNAILRKKGKKWISDKPFTETEQLAERIEMYLNQ